MTGYALPAQTAFVCPPISLRIKGDDSRPARRLTYCATQGPELAIQLFAERPGDNGSPHPYTAIKSRVLTGFQTPVKLLDTLLTDSTASHNHFLLCVHEDGLIMVFTEDLDGSAQTLGRDRSQELNIICAKVMNVETAQLTVLSKRGDIGARLQPDSDNTVSRLLLTLSKDSKEQAQSKASTLTLRLLSLTYTPSNKPSSVSCEELLSSTIVEPKRSTDTIEEFFFDDRNGDLYYHSSKCFTRYKFDGHGLRVYEHMNFDLPTDSCLQLGSTNIATSSGPIVSIVNTLYKSLSSRQAFYPQTSKRDRRQSEDDEPILRLCSYAASLKSAVAIYDGSLVSVPLEGQSLNRNPIRKRSHDEALISSVGRGWGAQGSQSMQKPKKGAKPYRFGTLVCAEVMSEEWEQTRSKLQELAEAKDDASFDDVVNNEFRTHQRRTDQQWKQTRRDNLHKIEWIISSLFHVGPRTSDLRGSDSSGPLALEIRFLPPQTFRWLVQCNALSSHQVELALKAHGKMPITASLPPDALIGAISSNAQGSRHLNRLLYSKCPLSPDEISHALRYALDRVENIAAEEGAGLQNGGDPHRATVELAEGSKAVTNSDLGSSTKVIHTIMQRCLRRLQDLDSGTIQQALKRNLATSQLRILLDCLRRDLACGGWLSQFVPGETSFFLPLSEERIERLIQPSDSNQEISIIAKFLNCILNALGVTSWINTATESDGNSDSNVLTHMKAEISAALEGIEEAAYLEGILGSALLYSGRADKAIKGDRSLRTRLDSNDKISRNTRTINWDSENNTEKVLYSKQGGLITHDNPTRKDTALPLDLYLSGDEKVGKTKVGTGGMVEKRGVREKEHLRSKQVGDYQFERIII